MPNSETVYFGLKSVLTTGNQINQHELPMGGQIDLIIHVLLEVIFDHFSVLLRAVRSTFDRLVVV